jgi:hypothetical protein
MQLMWSLPQVGEAIAVYLYIAVSFLFGMFIDVLAIISQQG